MHPLIAARFPSIRDLAPGSDPADAPEAALAWEATFGEHRFPAVDVERLQVPGPHGRVALRRYRPTGATGALPGLVWVHGGGFAAGDLDMVEAEVVSAEIAARAGADVVSVGYRLAAEGSRYPVPLDDVVAAWTWAVGRGGPFEHVGVAIGGASAGANLAASAALRVRDRGGRVPDALRLAYPALHFPVPALADELAAEMRDLPPMLRFTPQTVVEIFRNYLGRITDIPAGEAPGLADLTGLPPVRMVLSEYDDLRSSGELFALQLAERGIRCESTVAAGMLHGHLNLPPVAELPEVARSIDFLAAPW